MKKGTHISKIRRHLGAGCAITDKGEIINVNTPGASRYINNGKGLGFAPHEMGWVPPTTKTTTPWVKEKHPIMQITDTNSKEPVTGFGAYLTWDLLDSWQRLDLDLHAFFEKDGEITEHVYYMNTVVPVAWLSNDDVKGDNQITDGDIDFNFNERIFLNTHVRNLTANKTGITEKTIIPIGILSAGAWNLTIDCMGSANRNITLRFYSDFPLDSTILLGLTPGVSDNRGIRLMPNIILSESSRMLYCEVDVDDGEWGDFSVDVNVDLQLYTIPWENVDRVLIGIVAYVLRRNYNNSFDLLSEFPAEANPIFRIRDGEKVLTQEFPTGGVHGQIMGYLNEDGWNSDTSISWPS